MTSMIQEFLFDLCVCSRISSLTTSQTTFNWTPKHQIVQLNLSLAGQRHKDISDVSQFTTSFLGIEYFTNVFVFILCLCTFKLTTSYLCYVTKTKMFFLCIGISAIDWNGCATILHTFIWDVS